MTTLHAYQQDAVNKAIACFKSGTENRFRISMITGAGKTVTVIHTVERGMPAIVGDLHGMHVVVACHTNQLRDQFESEVVREVAEIGMGANWGVHTYQSLRDLKLKDFGGKPPLVLIVDEAHQGGLKQKDDAESSYQKIIKRLKPRFIISLSATDMGLDEDLFGEKTETNTFNFNLRDAIQGDFVNPCEIITIHSGLLQQLIDRNSGSAKEISGVNIESVGDQLEGLNVDFRDPESKLAIENGIIMSAIETYARLEVKDGKFTPAVFYVKTIEAADRAVDMFHKFFNTKKKLARAVHSESRESPKNIKDFVAGKYKVIFNVRQLQEGFNMPSLGLAFDCCPSFTNDGRIFTQRLGRVLRKAKAKEKSRYYLVSGVPQAYTRFEKPQFSETPVKAVDDIDLTDHTNILGEAQVVANINSGDEGMGATIAQPKVLDSFTSRADGGASLYLDDLTPRKITVISGGELIVTKTSGNHEKDRIGLRELLKKVEIDYSNLGEVARRIADEKVRRGIV